MKYRKLTAGVIAGAAALLAGLGSGVVQAAPVKPAALPVVQDATAVLPLAGAPLTVHIQTGPGGNLTLAEITPAFSTGSTGTSSPNNVTFTSAPDPVTGATVKVSVRSKGNTQSITGRAGSLKDISGDGSWTGGVFDVTKPAIVTYTIAESTTTPGAPDVKINTPADGATAPDGSKVQVLPTESMNDEEGGMSAVARVVFTLNGQSRTLSIGARVRTFVPEADDDETSSSVSATPPAPITVATLRITLSGFKGVAQSLTDAAGPKVWTGFLCDGTAATINYVVGPDGRLTLDPAVTPNIVPDPSKSNTEGNKIDVRWGDHERVQIRSRVDNGQVTITIMDKIRCKGAADPTVNGVDTVVPASHGDHHDGGGHDGKGSGGGDD